MNKRVSIKDVAREAGVSISTVSNALNNRGSVNQATKAFVLEVAARLHYIPNRSGRDLRAHETRAIGLFVKELTGTYYGVLADAIHNECLKHGYELYIFIVNKADTILQKTLGGGVDGSIIFYEYIAEEQLAILDRADVPLVYLDRDNICGSASGAIFDSFGAGLQAGKYLLGLGHKRIMYIAGLEDNYDSMQRELGLRQALAQQGLELEYRLEGKYSRATAYEAMQAFLKEGRPLPDAVFAANDLSAIGCIEALKAAGHSVPEEISVIGCDDIELCEMYTPHLTTIHTGIEQQAVLAVQSLMDILQHRQKGIVHKLPGHLVERDSCRARG